MRQWWMVVVWLGLPASAGLGQGVVLDSTVVLAPLTGQLATPAEGQDRLRMYSPDLGLTVVHEGELRIIFGDAVALRIGEPIGLLRDDIQGTLPIDLFPDGHAVENHLAAHPAAPGRPAWHRQGPPVTYRTDARGRFARIRLYASDTSGPELATGLFKAPIAAFSNAKASDESGFFTIYARSAPLSCDGGDAPRCRENFVCEPRLGKVGGDLLEDGVPCLLGSRGCGALAGGGLCVDATSSVYDPSSLSGLVQALVWRHSVGNADPVQHERYYTRPWDTNKFTNLSARTVKDFVPSRIEGRGNDYRSADGKSPNPKLLIWGRSGYVGTKANGRDLELYFAFVELPSYSATASFEWEPQYFAGISAAGEPQFASSQTQAKPLDLNGWPEPQDEVWDVVNQMSISWVEPLARWVMLYGGGSNERLADFLTFGQPELVEYDPEGAIQVRFARHPWGPWTAPEPVFAAGNPLPLDAPPAPGSHYAPSGILRHPQCRSDGCAPHEPSEYPDDYGLLYGPNIIDVWTEETRRGADIYWNLSTWHPYQVVLLKTSLHNSPSDAGPGPDPTGSVDDEADASVPAGEDEVSGGAAVEGDAGGAGSAASGDAAPQGGANARDEERLDTEGAARAGHPTCSVVATGERTWPALAITLAVLVALLARGASSRRRATATVRRPGRGQAACRRRSRSAQSRPRPDER